MSSQCIINAKRMSKICHTLLALMMASSALALEPTQGYTVTTENYSQENDTLRPPGNEYPAEMFSPDTAWKCPNITTPAVECSCDFPHTLRCTGDRTALQVINRRLRLNRAGPISLLDITVSGISTLPAHFLEGVALHGLVVSTGELRRVHENAFTALSRPLQALGLPNNLLESIPTKALEHLVGLDRLDLSHNKLKTLEADSFKGLANLTYLDLSDNLLSQLSPQAFSVLTSLRCLRMHGNHLSVSALSALRGLKTLEELHLSSNLLIGPVSPTLLLRMPLLRFLTVSENGLINVTQGALRGLQNLTWLSLSHNQIDVLEDHSFKYLSTLTRLDLADNKIVAVSSSSLAHLEKLITLDLTHNFLRSLTADLIVPLKSLQDLRLDDNDITMVASDVLSSELQLQKLSLSDNPLNCDCTLLDFANWLNNSTLSLEDKSSAVCATPPALENGVLTQVSPGSLLCGDPTPSIHRLPLAGAEVTLQDFQYDDSGINLLWKVHPCTDHYTCDALSTYETVGDSEVLTESSPLHCDSRLMRDACTLPVTLPSALHLQIGHKYRYCVVLLVPKHDDDYLIVGCSDIIALEQTMHRSTLTRPSSAIVPGTRVTAVRVNVSDQGFLYVDITLLNGDVASTECNLLVAVYAAESIIQQKRLNCSETFTTLTGVVPGHYKVCASLGDVKSFADQDERHCADVTVLKQTTEVILFTVIAVSCALLVVILVVGRSLVKRMRHPRIQTQCFLPAQEFEITHKAHYIKLLATTKV